MGRHMKDFVCIFLFISVRDFAPDNCKQSIVKYVSTSQSKLSVESSSRMCGK